MTELLLQALYSGALTGSSYALVALGLALVFGAMKIINLAHGELVLLAAYIAYSLEAGFGVNPLLTIPAAMLVVCAATSCTYLLVSLIRRDRELNSMLLTYGVAIMLTNVALLLWKADIRSTKSAWMQDSVVVGRLYSARGELLFFAF